MIVDKERRWVEIGGARLPLLPVQANWCDEVLFVPFENGWCCYLVAVDTLPEGTEFWLTLVTYDEAHRADRGSREWSIRGTRHGMVQIVDIRGGGESGDRPVLHPVGEPNLLQNLRALAEVDGP